jgi:hypothetical protein
LSFLVAISDFRSKEAHMSMYHSPGVKYENLTIADDDGSDYGCLWPYASNKYFVLFEKS